jgi:hypothetical protein
VAERGAGRGVVVAEIDLSFVRDVIDRARVGTTGYAYAVDSGGDLITHPNINLVLRHTSFASLPQVRAALHGSVKASADSSGHDQNGTKVLSAYETIEPLGWRVFVEEPLSEVLAPLKAAIWRTALLLVAFLILAIATSVPACPQARRPIRVDPDCGCQDRLRFAQRAREVPSNDELARRGVQRMAAQPGVVSSLGRGRADRSSPRH